VGHHGTDQDEIEHFALGEGQPVEITSFPSDGGGVCLFFVDDGATDNSGGYTVTLTPDVGSPIVVTVSAQQNCIDVARAAVIQVPGGDSSVSTAGDAWWKEVGDPHNGHYVNIVAMYEDVEVPPRRSFAAIAIDATSSPFPTCAAGSVRLFVTDLSGIIFDNGGDVHVTFEFTQEPHTYVVRPDGSGDFPTIQAAIDAAAPGDTIELADGTFVGDGNRDIDYHGKAITVRSRNGNPAVCIIDCEGTFGAPHRGFIFDSGEDSAAVLMGITVRHGYAAGSPPWCYGGGIFCDGSSPTFASCVISENQASTPVVRTTEWIAVRGAGIYLSGSSSTLTDCVFEENSAHFPPERPDAVPWTGAASMTADSGRVSLNWYYVHGGGMYCESSDLVLTRCIFTANEARQALGSPYGGGLFFQEGSIALVDCRFEGNRAAGHQTGFSKGGGAYLGGFGTVANLTRCWFSDNACNYQGGGTFGGDVFSYCGFDNNRAVRGGGVFTGAAVFSHCTFFGNTGWASGSAIAVDQFGSVNVENSILAFGRDGAAVWCDRWADVQAVCCDAYGNEGGDWFGCIAGQYGLNGNISLDPQFCDASGGDFTLEADSPCGPDYNPDCGLIGALPVGCPDAMTVAGGAAHARAMLWSVPNPFTGGTTIGYRLGSSSSADGVSVAIYDVAGRLVRTLRGKSAQATGQLRWDGTDDAGRALPGGIYLLRMAVDGRTVRERVVRIR
jgi:hypothetical protein